MGFLAKSQGHGVAEYLWTATLRVHIRQGMFAILKSVKRDRRHAFAALRGFAVARQRSNVGLDFGTERNNSDTSGSRAPWYSI